MAGGSDDTFSGGTKGFLQALGFILPLVGVEEIIRGYAGGQIYPGWPWIDVVMIVLGLPLHWAPAIWGLINQKSQTGTDGLQYLSRNDCDLGSAIRDMAWHSADGRWFAAQGLANNPKADSEAREDDLMRWASGRVWPALMDGKLRSRGRRRGRISFEDIPQTHWRSSLPHMVRDNAALWTMILLPTGGIEINQHGQPVHPRDEASHERTEQLRDYNEIIVDAQEFEALWPKNEPVADKARGKLLKRARCSGADPHEIKRLYYPAPSRLRTISPIAIGLLILAMAGIASFYLIHTASAKPRLILTYVGFAGRQLLKAGPLNIELRIINTGGADALIVSAKTTPLLVSGNTRRLPDAPIFPPETTATRMLKGFRIPPNVTYPGVTQTDMILSDAQVDSIKNGTTKLYYYGDFKYVGGEFAFISYYDPKLGSFFRDEDEYPTYGRAE